MKQIVVRVPSKLHRRVKVRAAYLGTTISQVIRDSLGEWVEFWDDRDPLPAGPVETKARTQRGRE